MTWVSGSVLYVLIWWITLFVVLPFGTRPEADPDPVTGWRGAPAKPMMLRKLLATTVLAALLWGACAYVIDAGWISFREGWLALPKD